MSTEILIIDDNSEIRAILQEIISDSEIVLGTVNVEGKPIRIPDVLNKFLN